jgi:hypothetical protein
MQDIKINDCDFAKLTKQGKTSQSEFKKRQGLVTKFFVWLMNSYIVPLLKNAFTISESMPGRNHVSYYRNGVWANAQQEALEQMQASAITPLVKEEAKGLISSRESLGLASLRFIPKTR